VVWKLAVDFHSAKFTIELRENHSGMETCSHFRWKNQNTPLRENHSGMETCSHFRWKNQNTPLRENHSGMETFLLQEWLVSSECCVRTIVVWKQVFHYTQSYTSGIVA